MVNSADQLHPPTKQARQIYARREGFTLVELLVVIGIIAVLVSLLLPAISLVQQQTQSTKCLSNLRQIGIAISSYANDHDYCLVPGDYWGKVDSFIQNGGGSWCDILADQSYLNVPIGHIGSPGNNKADFGNLYDVENILVCPTTTDDNVLSYDISMHPNSQTDPIGMMWFARASDTTLEAVRTSYACNTFPDPVENSNRMPPFNLLPNNHADVPNWDWRINKLSQFSNDVALPLVFDGVWMFNADPNRINARHMRHTQTNILFADFHCEAQATSTLPNDDWYVK